jgi:LysR family transcriptional regulator, hydrogen peroxide-inducible genes activator
MEMHQIRYFLAVVQELNFTRAAEKCNVSQPSLTRAIKLLEDELGGPLFHRERANTHLSELGRIVRPHLEQLLKEAEQTRLAAQDFRQLKRTSLKLGIMCTVAPYQFVDLIAGVLFRHSGIELDLVDASGIELQDRLLSGDLEAAIYWLPEQEEDEKTRLHRIPLFREQYMAVVNPRHRFAKANAVRAADLNGERYVCRVKCEWSGRAGAIWEARGADVAVVYRSERDDWILAMIAAGLGFGFLPEKSVAHLRANSGVVARPIVEPEFWREPALVTVRGRPHSPAVGALVREAIKVRSARS